MAGGEDTTATATSQRIRDCRGRYARERRDRNGRARDSFGRFVHEDFARAWPGRDERVPPQRVQRLQRELHHHHYAHNVQQPLTQGTAATWSLAVTYPSYIATNAGVNLARQQYAAYWQGTGTAVVGHPHLWAAATNTTSDTQYLHYSNVTNGTGSVSWAGTTTDAVIGRLDVKPEPVVTAELRIEAKRFDDHPDPDVLIGEGMDELRQKLEEALGMRLDRDAVWAKWTSESFTNDVLLRAEWTPRKLTVEAWDAWQKLPKLRRVFDQATRAYIEIDEAELRRREWQATRQRLVASNRTRAAKLREQASQRRANELLLTMLDEAQAEQWRTERAFTIETADGARRYRIRRGVAGNIMLVKDGDREAPAGGWLRRFCFHAYHPDGQIPVEDHVLAQKLFIESDEASFLRLANPA